MSQSLKALQSLRPRERLLQHGPDALTDAELLAILLRTGTTQLDVLSLAKKLLEQFSGFRGLLAADSSQLQRISGIGVAKSCELIAVSEISKRALAEHLCTQGSVLNSPGIVKNYCIALLAHQPIEHCIALYLDNQLQLIVSEEVARGTINQASVYPREILRSALKHHACAVILAHNHPSGIREASQADIQLTRHVKSALSLIDIRLIDHLIITPGHALSMAEQGLF